MDQLLQTAESLHGDVVDLVLRQAEGEHDGQPAEGPLAEHLDVVSVEAEGPEGLVRLQDKDRIWSTWN